MQSASGAALALRLSVFCFDSCDMATMTKANQSEEDDDVSETIKVVKVDRTVNLSCSMRVVVSTQLGETPLDNPLC